MATPTITDAQLRARDHLLRRLSAQDLPAPDDVEFSDTEMRFLWHGPQIAVVIDLSIDKSTSPDGS